MQRFSKLYTNIEETNDPGVKVDYLIEYLDIAPDSDKLWALALLLNKGTKKVISPTHLREWGEELARIPSWLLDECHKHVGDIAETIALIAPITTRILNYTLSEWIEYISDLKKQNDLVKKEKVLFAWRNLEQDERFIFNKILTAGIRIDVSKKTIIDAISKHLTTQKYVVSYRLNSVWSPKDSNFESLFIDSNAKDQIVKPYPFYPTRSVKPDISQLGDLSEWWIEEKWDGIRSQMVFRNNDLYIWSKEDELINNLFPEFRILVGSIPDGTVLDGEIISFSNGIPQPSNTLQNRMGSKKITRKLVDNNPIVFIAYDLLECNGTDIRSKSLTNRKDLLHSLIIEQKSSLITLSSRLLIDSWTSASKLKQTSRERNTKGLILKSINSKYIIGKTKGGWLKYSVNPYLIDGILIYAQRNDGKRVGLFTEFTFAVWEGTQHIPFTKTAIGLNPDELEEINTFIQGNTIEKFGPISVVKPKLVFEISFEDIFESKRHKSGVVLKDPKIYKWKKEKPSTEANKLSDLMLLVKT